MEILLSEEERIILLDALHNYKGLAAVELRKRLEKDIASTGITIFPTGIEDIDLLILDLWDDETLFNACRTNKATAQLCRNEAFWYNRIVNRFHPEGNILEYKPANLSYKQLYKLLINPLNNPLHIAIEFGILPLVKALFPERHRLATRHADYMAEREAKHEEPIRYISKEDGEEEGMYIRHLLDQAADRDRADLGYAIRLATLAGYLDTLRYLLANMYDLEIVTSLAVEDPASVIADLAEQGKEDTIIYLFDLDDKLNALSTNMSVHEIKRIEGGDLYPALEILVEKKSKKLEEIIERIIEGHSVSIYHILHLIFSLAEDQDDLVNHLITKYNLKWKNIFGNLPNDDARQKAIRYVPEDQLLSVIRDPHQGANFIKEYYEYKKKNDENYHFPSKLVLQAMEEGRPPIIVDPLYRGTKETKTVKAARRKWVEDRRARRMAEKERREANKKRRANKKRSGESDSESD